MTKKVVFITGANKGIGYEVARQLAANEFIVLLGARNQQRGEAAANKLRAEGEVYFVPIDVTDERSIAAAGSPRFNTQATIACQTSIHTSRIWTIDKSLSRCAWI
jgi:short-subunit dehydrogenase